MLIYIFGGFVLVGLIMIITNIRKDNKHAIAISAIGFVAMICGLMFLMYTAICIPSEEEVQSILDHYSQLKIEITTVEDKGLRISSDFITLKNDIDEMNSMIIQHRDGCNSKIYCIYYSPEIANLEIIEYE